MLICAGRLQIMKSRLLLREIFRDWFANRLNDEDRINLEMIVKSNSHFLVDNHPLTLRMLDDWASGYTLFEIAQRNNTHIGVTKDALRFAFELLGRKLEIDDGSVLREVPPQLHATARNVFNAYYDTFTELPEQDQEV
jgi:hypothetical protein